jgi:serine/threonine protein kinase
VGWTKQNKALKYAIKTMKKAEIIKSKHVDHIENEKSILEKIQHPFVVSRALFRLTKQPLFNIKFLTYAHSLNTMASCKMRGTSIS